MPSLTADDIDDLLYLTRTNETQELDATISALAATHQCTAKEILEACVDSENGNTVLHYCAANGFADLLQRLLQSAESSTRLVNHQNAQGNTPLHWAAYNGHLDAVKALLHEGRADMWVKNAAGHLAMFEAERADRNEVVQFLLEAGGKEVERTGTEGEPSAEDVRDVQDGEDDAVVAGASTDIDMHESGPG